MNILITSSSSKVLLVKSFKEVLESGSKVFTGDITQNVATTFFSDHHFVLPRTSDKDNFSNHLLDVCKANNISLIIPTRDGELSVMAELKDKFLNEEVTILVPQASTTDICLDKKMFSEFVESIGIRSVPVIHDLNMANPPYFIRPVCGASSVGVRIADSHEEAKLFMNEDFLIHPFIDLDEFSIDLLMDLEGQTALQAVCRQRTMIVGGESKISTTVDIPELEQACLKIGKELGLVGHNVLQAFYSEDSGIIMIEANTRFGGASNLSINAGLDSPRRIVQMMTGDKSAYDNSEIKFGLSMYRYAEDVIK